MTFLVMVVIYQLFVIGCRLESMHKTMKQVHNIKDEDEKIIIASW